ncbi:helix-turn-helix transcriptional regulator [Priestia megaterium]|uniref:helix-turn-helix transcriptional regulator n=1 Tax=Priestia megaterium TaxID=1404 RepID=UPI002E209FEA|nr:helix-turn-helix transcriptional regulator [Priestia megaterium]
MLKISTQNSIDQYTLDNINKYIQEEGFKIARLAKRLGMTTQNVYAYLRNERKGILEFSKQLALVLGHEETYFMNPDFKLPYNEEHVRQLAFSAGEKLSPEAQEGFNKLLKVCDLYEVYSLEV